MSNDINQGRMESDTSNKLPIVDQINNLMGTCAGPSDKEWLFLCQSLEDCESAGSEMGLKFMDEMSVLSAFRVFIGMKSRTESNQESQSNKRKRSKKSAENDILKRRILNITVGVEEETGPSQGKRRKTGKRDADKNHCETRQKDLDAIENRVSIELTDSVSSKIPTEQILSREIKVEIDTSEFETEQVGEILDIHSEDTDGSNFDGLENEHVDKSESLVQEQSLVKTEQIKEDGSAYDLTINKDPYLMSDVRDKYDELTCEICGRANASSSSQIAESDSLATNPKESQFLCSLCQGALKSRKTEKPQSHCEVCLKSFTREDQLRKHVQSHDQDKHQGYVLLRNETDISDLSSRETDKDTGAKSIQDNLHKFQCSKCGAKFLTALQLQNHRSRKKACGNKEVLLRENLPDEVVIYQDKSTGEEVKTTLLDLLKTVKFRSSQHSCIACQRVFKKYSNLQNHIIMCHSNVKPHSCEFCKKSFKTEHNMDLHKFSMHKDLLKCISCELCGAECLTKEKLENHKVLRCPKRKEQTFTRKDRFRKHVQSHDQDKHQGFVLLRNETDKISDLSSRETDKDTGAKSMAQDGNSDIPSNKNAKQILVSSENVNILRLKSTAVKPDENRNGRKLAYQLERFDAQDVELNTNDMTCTICFKTFNSDTALRGHQNAHRKAKCETIEKVQDDSQKFQCSKCGAKFLTALQLQNHRSRKKACGNKEVLLRENLPDEVVIYQDKSTGEEVKTTLLDLLKTVKFRSSQHSCIACQRVFKKYSNLQNHIIMCHSNVEPHSCEFCKKSFKTEHNMDLHKFSMHKDLLKCISCELCGAECLTKEKLENHKVLRCPKRIKQTFKCDQCNYTINNRSKYDTHMQSHTATASIRYTCQICNKSLSSTSALNTHLRAVHSTETPFKCTICDAAFKYRGLARLHQRTEHEKPRYHCDICNKSFRHINYFKIHAQYHTNERGFICEMCGKSFQSKNALWMHQKSHADKKTYKCSMCDATFHRLRYLVYHEARHKPDRYICDVCGSTFVHLSKLQSHRNRHSETYNRDHYTCKICDKNCESITRYKTHIVRFHPDSVPMMESTSSLRFHKCSLCPKQFSYAWSLKKHLEVHDQKSVSCPKCFKLFSSDEHLETHMKKKHRPQKSADKPETANSSDVINTDSKPPKSALKSVKSEKKTTPKRKATPKKAKTKRKIQNNLLKLQPKVDQNIKEYTAVKASNLEDSQSLPYVESDNAVNQVLPLVNNLMIAAYIRGNDVGTNGTYAKMMTPPFFPNL